MKIGYKLPNIRKLFTPDPGYTFFDMDLNRADLQVVVWEMDDADLKLVLKKSIDMHCFNACSIFGITGIPPEELVEGDEKLGIPQHLNYKEHRARIGYVKRHSAKEGCHAVNYYCQAATLAATMGTSIAEADRFIRRWLGAHPGIGRWHQRTKDLLKNGRTVHNKFGYRRFFFDRIDSILPEALAWVPQSTVANVINEVWARIDANLPDVQILLQVHDSLGGQFPTEKSTQRLEDLREISQVVIPYDDPLVIPTGIKVSNISWGECV